MSTLQGGFAWPRLTPGVKLLLMINGAVFVLNALLVGRLAHVFGLSWDGLADGFGLGILRLVTYQFVHSFTGIGHILFNMLFLYFLGTFVEGAIGKTRLLRLYLISGIAGGVLQMIFVPLLGQNPGIPTVGASGSVYGILVYAACIAPRMQIILIIFPIQLRWLAIGLVFIGVYYTYVEMVTGLGGGVAHGGHLGGALWGYLAYRTRHRNFAWLDRLQNMRHQRQARSNARDREILDHLLDKVKREGVGSLTRAERRFLDKASARLRNRS